MVTVVLVIITGGVIVRQVLIPHDGDGSVWWNVVYTDHQVEEVVHENVWGVEIFMLDSELGKTRPERPIRVMYFKVKRDRVTLSESPLLNGVSFQFICEYM